jgi:hypothetical protein
MELVRHMSSAHVRRSLGARGGGRHAPHVVAARAASARGREDEDEQQERRGWADGLVRLQFVDAGWCSVRRTQARARPPVAAGVHGGLLWPGQGIGHQLLHRRLRHSFIHPEALEAQLHYIYTDTLPNV